MSFYRYPRPRPSLPHDIPGSMFIMAANALSFVFLFLTGRPPVLDWLVSTSLTVWQSPWTLLTYPLISRPGDAWKFISLLFGLWWVYIVGGLLERSWGTRRFLTVFFTFSAISAFFISIGALLLNLEVGFGELFCPLVDLTVIWAMLEPEAPVMLLIFPMQLRWLAVITCFMVLFDFGTPNPLLGFFALGGPVAAALYARYLRGDSQSSRARTYAGSSRAPLKIWSMLNPFEWYRRWKFKRRFKRLWGD